MADREPGYSLLVRRLDLPGDFDPPARLVYDDIVATALSRADLDDDVHGINSSLDLIRETRGGGWPSDAVSGEGNFIDLVWHECEFRERFSYSYVVRQADGRYLGCCYLYPVGRRAPLTPETAHHDVDVSWWVTRDAYAQGYYEKLHQALMRWVVDDYPFRDPLFSNVLIPGE